MCHLLSSFCTVKNIFSHKNYLLSGEKTSDPGPHSQAWGVQTSQVLTNQISYHETLANQRPDSRQVNLYWFSGIASILTKQCWETLTSSTSGDAAGPSEHYFVTRQSILCSAGLIKYALIILMWMRDSWVTAERLWLWETAKRDCMKNEE